MKDLCRHAVDAARTRGAEYADARVVRLRTQSLAAEDRRVAGISDSESIGIGVRARVRGAWGFAAGAEVSRAEAERVAARAVEIAEASARLPPAQATPWASEPGHEGLFQTPVGKDPFRVTLETKIELLLAINAATLAVRGVTKCHSGMWFRREHRFLATSDGTAIESDTCTSTAQYRATAVDATTAKSRYFEAYPLAAGYEHIENTPLLAEAQRVGEEAVAKLKGRPCPVGTKDLVLHPSNLHLTLHESVGHATELDRVLGMEESLAGSSFATTDQLGSLRYGSALMNIVCDNTLPNGLATRGWDDEGVPGQKWHVVRNGVLVDYQTSRQVCRAIGADRSHGSCRADSWRSVPIIRQSNIGLAPGEQPLTPDELIADTRDGIYIDGRGSFSIDQKRLNFQFGGDCFWEIKNGRKGAILKDVTYQAITPRFWGALDAVCDERFWIPCGTTNCGKGDPGQAAQMTHGTATARFRQIRVGATQP
ncbi:MAG: TldD/PmbA family protein [Kiritimatiellae bacterium]|nr:TldD/PmbA family protein [Kiritimatiellia bacterium]